MRAWTWWLGLLLAAGLFLAPQTVYAQTEGGGIPDTILPFPNYHNHPGKGGFCTYAEFVLFRQTNILEHQPIAYRGFIDNAGAILGFSGQFIGSGEMVLDAKDAGGPGTYQPGVKLGIGYRFQDGAFLSLDWMWLTKAQYWHTATIVPQDYHWGFFLEDSFITAPVFNFSNFFAGPPNKVTNPVTGVNQITYGIWNAADLMTIRFEQSTQQLDLTFRQPIYAMEGWRSYGLIGPRFFWIWESFKWTTINEDPNGYPDPLNTAVYTNIVSNRMYGLNLGWGNDWWFGNGVAVSLDLGVAGFLDIVKMRARYQLGDKSFPGAVKRSVTDYTLVPEFYGNLNLWYYPFEGIQLRVGYNVMSFLNTMAAPKPVSFNFGGLDPDWQRRGRLFDGLNAGIAIIW
jgi:hypothetical protein